MKKIMPFIVFIILFFIFCNSAYAYLNIVHKPTDKTVLYSIDACFYDLNGNSSCLTSYNPFSEVGRVFTYEANKLAYIFLYDHNIEEDGPIYKVISMNFTHPSFKEKLYTEIYSSSPYYGNRRVTNTDIHVWYEVGGDYKLFCPVKFNFGVNIEEVVFNDTVFNTTKGLIINNPEGGVLLYGSDISIFVFLNRTSYVEIIENSVLSICTKKQFNNDTLDISLAIGESSDNIVEDFDIIGLGYLHPLIYTLGTEETFKAEIEIKEFFRGSIIDWHPELPYCDLSLDIYPENESYDKNETLSLKFKNTKGEYELESLFYRERDGLKRWRFPETGNTRQIKFDYDSWLFPLSEYKTVIFIENNLSINISQDLDISGSEFLSGKATNSTYENITVIEIRIFQNWTTYMVLLLILFTFYVFLLYSFYMVKKKKTHSFIYLFQLIPIGTIFIKDLVPVNSILFFVLILSIIPFWFYYLYDKFIR